MDDLEKRYQEMKRAQPPPQPQARVAPGNLDDYERVYQEQKRIGEAMRAQQDAANLGQGGMGDETLGPWDQARIAAGDTLSEKQAIFNSIYPQGQLRLVTPLAGGRDKRLAFKVDPSKPFSEVDPPGFDAGEIPRFLGQDAGALAGEIGGAAISRSIPGAIIKTGVGAMLGEGAQEGLEWAAFPDQDEPAEEAAGRAFGKGVLTSAGGTAGELLGRTYRAGRGGGFLEPKEGALLASEAGERQGLEPLSLGQGAKTPLVERFENISKRLGSAFLDLLRKQESTAISAMGRGRLSTDNTVNAMLQLVANEKTRLLNKIKMPSGNSEKAAEALTKGIKEYGETSKVSVDTLYDAARAVEEPQFNIDELQKLAANFKEGVVAQSNQPAAASGLLGPDGKPLASTEMGTFKANESSPAFMKMIDRILQFDPNVPAMPRQTGGISSSTDQLKAIASDLWDYKQPSGRDIVSSGDQGRAGKLLGELNKALDAPAASAPGFAEAWGAARAAAKDRFDTLEKSFVVKMAQTDTPEAVARSFVAAPNKENLLLMRRVLPTARFAEVQEFAKKELLGSGKLDIDNLASKMDTLQRDGSLDIIMSPGEQSGYRDLAKGWAQVQKLDVEKIVEDNVLAKQTIEAIVSKSRPADGIALAKQVVQPGMKEQKRAVQGGLYDFIYNAAVVKKETGDVIDPGAMDRAIEALKSAELFNILGRSQRQIVNDVKTYASFLKEQTDVGGSMAAGGRASGALEKALGGNVFGALFDVGHTIGFGALIAKPGVRKFMTQRKVIPRSRIPAAVGGALSLIAQPEGNL